MRAKHTLIPPPPFPPISALVEKWRLVNRKRFVFPSLQRQNLLLLCNERSSGHIVTGLSSRFQLTVLLGSLGPEWRFFATNSRRRMWLCKLGIIYILEVSNRVRSMSRPILMLYNYGYFLNGKKVNQITLFGSKMVP
ncbi:hypothetical protein TNCV_3937211 [Trichonephila clavipes]|nr:hypothetical protein TNCV_3937211 [Trichonephila clavipes]